MEIKKLEKSQMEIRTFVPWKEWQGFIAPAVKKLAAEIKVPGFRPGKAPRAVVENYMGQESVLNEAAVQAIQKNYAAILEKEKIAAIGQPRLEILKLAEGNDLEYKITTAVIPEIILNEWKDSVKEINKRFQKEKVEVKTEEIEKELEKLANSRVKLVTVNREARSGDNVEIDFQISRDGIVIENGTARKHNFILGRGTFIPGFEDQIIEMKAGEEKEFSLNFPADYHAKHLAGKKADFKVKVNLVQERQIPNIDDNFAVSLGKFENLTALKKSLEEGILEEKKYNLQEKQRADWTEELVKKTQTELPDILIKEEIAKMIGEFDAQVQTMGMTLEDYLQKMNKKREDLEKDWKPQAEKRIKAALALEKIATDEKIEVSKEKIEAEMNKTLQYYKNIQDVEKNLDLSRLYEYVRASLRNEEVFKFLEKI